MLTVTHTPTSVISSSANEPATQSGSLKDFVLKIFSDIKSALGKGTCFSRPESAPELIVQPQPPVEISAQNSPVKKLSIVKLPEAEIYSCSDSGNSTTPDTTGDGDDIRRSRMGPRARIQPSPSPHADL